MEGNSEKEGFDQQREFQTIGSGRNSRIWRDSWAGNKMDKLVRPINSEWTNEYFDHFTVDMLLDAHTKQWHWETLQRFIAPHQW